jgi:hypothetical protein
MAPITVVVVGRNSDKEIENGKELYKGELFKKSRKPSNFQPARRAKKLAGLLRRGQGARRL